MKIKFDYRFDTKGFFNNPEAREALEKAGEIWSNLLKDDFENIPVGVELTVQNPQTGADEIVILDKEIDDLIIFVGAASTPFESQDLGGTGAELNNNSQSGLTRCYCSLCSKISNNSDLSQRGILSNNQEPTANLETESVILAQAKYDGTDLIADIFQRRISGNFRGQGVVTSDFEPWMGSISFDEDVAWDFSLEATDLDPAKFDFISVTLHEIAHVLGIGTSPTFITIGEGGTFDGVNALEANDGRSIPLESTLDHVLEGFLNDSVLLDPIFGENRTLPSDIDLALLADIGYEIEGFTQQGEQPALATESAELITGATFEDNLNALGGNDTVVSYGGDDTLNGGKGADGIDSGDGNDSVFGGDGNDSVFGQSGNDTIDGGIGNDSILGNNDDDSLTGNDGNDSLWGEAGDDILQGNNNDDEIAGGEGNDSLLGNNGQDLLQGGTGKDSLEGGSGDDGLSGGDHEDIIGGGEGNDSLFGGENNDVLSGGQGDDNISGNNGEDIINGGEGNDTLFGNEQSDRFVFNSGSGNDTIGSFISTEDIIEISADYGFDDSNDVINATKQIGKVTETNQLVSQVTLDKTNSITVFHDVALTAEDFTVNFPLQVTAFTSTASGFIVQFNEDIDLDLLNVDDRGLRTGDLILKNSAGEKIAGSIVYSQSDRTLTFVKNEVVLAPDDYNLTLFSRDSGFVSELDGGLLDGDGDGNDGGNYVQNFTLDNSDRRILSVNDFSQGLTDLTGEQLTVALDEGTEVTEVEFTLIYNPELFNITDAIINPDLADDWQIVTETLEAGQAHISVSGTTPLDSGKVDLVSFSSEFPADVAYGKSDLLQLESITLNDGNLEVIADNGILQTAYIGDVNQDTVYSNDDAALISHLAVGINSGFDDFALNDPSVIADVNNDGVISAFDSYLIATQDIM